MGMTHTLPKIQSIKLINMSDIILEKATISGLPRGLHEGKVLDLSSINYLFGANGSDVAIENADIALMNNNLSLIPYLVKLGIETVKTIRFNITSAIIKQSCLGNLC